jgi:hypothetical protein
VSDQVEPGWSLAYPIFLPKGATLEHFLVGPSPWGMPLALGVAGTTDRSEPAVWLSLEQPVAWMRPDARLDKAFVEFAHLQRFAADARLASGADPYTAIEQNQTDPPDFFAWQEDGARVGVELAAFSIEERRQAQALFGVLKKRLIDQQRHRTGHLAGTCVVVRFGEGQNPNTRPPRTTDEAAADELIEALVTYRPDVERLRVDLADGGPVQLPPLGDITTPRQATFFAMPLLNASPTGLFHTLTGFEIALSYTTCHTAATVGETLDRLVQDHDKPGVDVLVLSVGAPDRNGAMYPLEQFLSDLYLTHPRVLTTNNIARVIMHRWGTGDAFDLLPDPPQRLWPPLYAGVVPAHQPFVGPPPPNLGSS